MEASDAHHSLFEVEDERHKQARLLRAASHDIRGPLANVRSYASLLADPRMELPEKARRAVEVIIRNADKALLLLREFIDSEQATRGILDLPLQPVALQPVVERAVRQATRSLEERQLRLTVDERVQSAVEAEPTALEHIVRVLIDHAAERSEAGGELLLEVFADEGHRICVRMVDRGPRLSQEEQAALFDRDTHLSRRAKLTTGFRLSLAATEAALMGGGLEVSSRDGETSLMLRLRAAPT